MSKISFLLNECFISRPPEGCTQWFTEPSGTISDWSGSDNLLQDDLNYNICVRQNMGYCCVEYKVREKMRSKCQKKTWIYSNIGKFGRL